MTTLEEAYEEFRKLPDWDRYPMPEKFYTHFNLKKPKASYEINELLTYTPPPSMGLNFKGKIEIRKPDDKGVRDLKLEASLPVEIKHVNEETGELEDYPSPKPALTYNDVKMLKDDFSWESYLDTIKLKSITNEQPKQKEG